jgi:F-type H+-transporting ATPase subunit gamma
LNNKVEIVTVGKKANGYFKYRNIEPKQNYEGITDEPNFENALEIMTPLVQEFYDGKTNQIEIVYTEYKSAMTQTALYKTVLPFEVEQIAKEIESVGGYTFEPSASQVLSNIIPKYTNATIFSSLLNASTSEHASRMRAMKAATENAEELIKILSRQSNQARQAEITTEISEIVGGAEALAG